MKNTMNEEKILKVDFDSAFPDTPLIVDQAIFKAQADIARYERKKRFIRLGISAAAACLVIFAGISVLLMRGDGISSDKITPPVFSESEIKIDMETPVFTCKSDAYYHADIRCKSSYAESVDLPLITAIEFEKAACPLCASHLNTGNVAAQTRQSTQKGIVQYRSDSKGAAEELKELSNPVYTAEFFGGALSVYELNEDCYIGCTDPTPDEAVFKYIMIGRKEIDAESYYEMNEGPGIYEKYEPETKLLVTSWGDGYESHVYYEYIIEVEIMDEKTGECAWRMNREQYNAFLKDAALVVSERADAWQPSMSAALET